ncbi:MULTISPECIES: NAD-dependent succinate-semialdehyde dehydrogenase [unclassified Thalassospira]|uniref:NAD-dependent succinate-semialdehyde dehydrogenase n=1 Tax=unclassified Thalassospira TaxID=2648997 RepID=UPI0007A5F30F|nr:MULTISPECIES: NAD-dependent succinate-semialdehyde dehydrogenase [unclassified Thalassospira]KZD01229.1 NAD-dependent succinate-semialdehyde dehydrogenase [Thalassospira sp. MCCC 1A02898]ONH85480.1 aldehyde dehydrogenase [Thalassospira sp. MCCC 1A02803]
MTAQSKEQRCVSLSQLSDLRLLREHAYIDGRWCSADNLQVIEVTNPFDGSFIGTVPNMGVHETRKAIAAAREAFPAWAALLPQERSAALRRWHDLLIENKEDLALLMTLEQGKPINEARGEIDYAASFIEFYAEEAKRVNVENITSHLPGRNMTIKREPIGVTAAVTPWNFPCAMITRKAAAALAAGCTMIVRPATETPFSATALAELAERAGIPAGVFNIVTGDPNPVVGELCGHHDVRALSFTGSTEVGRLLLSQGAQTIKKMSMELGGHAPFIVFDDVDLDEAVAHAVNAKFATSGQDCLAANRIFVQRDIYDDFLDKYAKAIADLRVGNGIEEYVEIGPLMHDRAVAKCEEHVADARAKGARVVTGGKKMGGLFFAPTLLADVTDEMKIFSEETFGPVAPVMAFDTEDEVVAKANDSEYGLAAYLLTKDNDRAARVSNALEYGMVALNCVKITGAPIPFGGVKQSGLGREGSRHGLEEFTELKYVCAAYKA